MSTVSRIEYGRYSGGFAWGSTSKNVSARPLAFLTFSVFTPNRSYDFIARDEEQCHFWVVGLGILVSKYGGIAIQSRFVFTIC